MAHMLGEQSCSRLWTVRGVVCWWVHATPTKLANLNPYIMQISGIAQPEVIPHRTRSDSASPKDFPPSIVSDAVVTRGPPSLVIVSLTFCQI
jgi:hypothetical protein